MRKKLLSQAPPQTRGILPDAIVLAALMLAGLFLPAVCYTYNSTVYNLHGYRFLTGASIAGGTVAVRPNALMIIVAVCAAAVIILALLAGKVGRRTAGIALLAAAVVAAAAAIVFSMTVEGALSAAGARRVGVLWGHLVPIAAAALLFMRGLHILHQEGLLPATFDIAGFAVMAVMSLAAPFATYTYKRVSHPFTGFDLMTRKEVAEGTLTQLSLLPYVIAVCALALAVLAVRPLARRRVTAVLMLICSAAVIVCMVAATVSLKGTLSAAKDAQTTFGTALPILFGAVIFARTLHLLYQEKVLSALDFMMVPGLVYLLINNYLPMVGISLAFKKIDYSLGIWESPWVGLDDFKYLFSTETAWIITRNTLLYNLAFIVIGIFTGMVVGICLASVTKKIVQSFYQTSILLPQLISMIVVAYIVFAFLSNEAGFINKAILGKGNEINFYGTEKVWPFLLAFVHNWKQVGYNSVIFLSSIVGIDRGLYEAAMVDGCSPWQQITKITIPQLKPTIITLTLLQVGRVFYSDFGLFYQVPMDSGALYNVTNTIDTYVYRSMMVLNNISSASAASAFQSVCGFLLVFTVNMIVRKLDRDNALF